MARSGVSVHRLGQLAVRCCCGEVALAIQEEDGNDDVGKRAAIVPVEEMMVLEGGRSAGDGCGREARVKRMKSYVPPLQSTCSMKCQKERKEDGREERTCQSPYHLNARCLYGGVWTCGELLNKFMKKMHFRSSWT